MTEQDNLRPTTFASFVGQTEAKERLSIAIKASIIRDEPVPHILLGGSSAGIGKTSLSYIISNERGVKASYLNMPGVKKISELIPVLTSMKRNDVLILDEIHNMSKQLAENLLPVLEDSKLTIKLLNKEVITIPLVPFTIIGCSTEIGKLIKPLLERFEIPFSLQPYTDDEIGRIILQNIAKLELQCEDGVNQNIGNRSRGIPRIGNRLLKRARDFAQVKGHSVLTNDMINLAMQLEKIDERGLSEVDKKYLSVIFSTYSGGPVGLNTMASTIGEDIITVKDFVEPFLIRTSLIAVTKNGRILTSAGVKLCLTFPRKVV